MLGNLCKNWYQGYCVQTGVNFAFVLTPKSALKSSSQSRPDIYITFTISLVFLVLYAGINRYSIIDGIGLNQTFVPSCCFSIHHV